MIPHEQKCPYLKSELYCGKRNLDSKTDSFLLMINDIRAQIKQHLPTKKSLNTMGIDMKIFEDDELVIFLY